MSIDEIHYLIDAGRFDDAISQINMTPGNEIYFTLMKVEITLREQDYLKTKKLLDSVTGKEISDFDNFYLVYCRCFLWTRTTTPTHLAPIL